MRLLFLGIIFAVEGAVCFELVHTGHWIAGLVLMLIILCGVKIHD